MAYIFNPFTGQFDFYLPSNPSFAGVKFATIGDSQLADGTSSVNTGGVAGGFAATGGLTWARIFSGQVIDYQPAYNFAVGGTTWSSAPGQLASALAITPDYIYMDWGTNDSGGGPSGLATSLASAYTTFRACFAANVQPIVRLVPVRSDAGFSTASMQWINSYNKTIQDLCSGRPDLVLAAGLAHNKLPICLDVSGYANYTSSSGGSNPEMVGSDGLHIAMGGAIYDGYQIAQIILKKHPQPLAHETNPYDIYNGTNLINGNMAIFGGVNQGMFQGTGGYLTAASGVTPTGQIAPYWQATAGNVASTATMACSKENPRTDGLISGERQRITINSAGGGNSQELYALNLVNGVQGIRGSYSAGDIIVCKIRAQILSCVGLQGIQCELQESGPATPQTNADCILESNGVVGCSTAQFPQLLQPLVLQTQPMTLQSGNTDLFFKIIMGLYGAGGANSLDILFSDLRVYKIVPN